MDIAYTLFFGITITVVTYFMHNSCFFSPVQFVLVLKDIDPNLKLLKIRGECLASIHKTLFERSKINNLEGT